MNIRDGAKLALWLFLCAACSGDFTRDGDALPGVTFEPIIGGTPATGYPEAAYLNIDMTPSGGWACSGALIAPRVVLTAGHCVDSHSYWEVYVGNAYRQTSSAAVYDYNENGSETVNPAHHDIGLVFLSDPVNLTSYPSLSKVKVADNTSVIDVGRVKNGVVQSTEYQASTSVSAGDKVGYPFDYTSKDVIEPGDSGGPVFTAGTHTLIAVNSGAANGIQVLARTDLLYDWITSQIAAHGGTSAAGGSGGSGGAASSGGSAGKPAGTGGAAGKSAAGTGGAAGKSAAGTGGTVGKAGGSGPSAAGSGGSAGSKAGSAGTPGAGSAKAGAGGAGGASTCSGAREIEPNDAWSQATALSGTACGELATTSDVDWYSVSASVGTHVLALSSAADAAFSVGVASGSNCVLSISNVKSANVTVSGAPATLCIKASSASKKTQSYGLTFK